MTVLYFLPPAAQRKRRNGMPQPGRLFLANGTELKGVARLHAEMAAEPMLMSEVGAVKSRPALDRLVIEIDRPRVLTLSKRPKKGRK